MSPFFLLWPVTSGVVVLPPPPPPAPDGPWRLLSPEWPQPKKREVEKIFWPGDANYEPLRPRPAPQPVPDAQSVDVVLRDPGGALVAAVIVSRGTDPLIAEQLEREEEAAIALLLLG